MPELTADFIRNGGTYMVLGAKGGLHSRQFNRVQRSMLSSVSIPNLLRLDVREVDFEVSLHYEITGKRMLSQCLKQEKITMPELYGLLMQIAEALDDCKQFMLTPLNFYLDVDFIFVEEPLSSGILYFTYLPFTETLSAESLSGALIGLITRLITSVSTMEGEGIQQLLRLCSDELFSLSEFKKLLVRLMAGEEPASAGGTGYHGPEKLPCRPDSRSSAATIKEYVPEQDVPASAGDLYTSISDIYGEEVCSAFPGASEPGGRISQSSASSRVYTYIFGGTVLAAALLWKLIYFDHPGSLNRSICLALTVLLIAAALLILRGRWSLLLGSRPLKVGDANKNEMAEQADEDNEDSSWKQSWRWDHPSGSELGSTPPLNQAASNQTASNQAFNIWHGSVLEPQESGPAVPSPPLPEQRTVLLREAAVPEKLSSSTARFTLERRQTEQAAESNPEIITLRKGSFVIGRSEEICQYVDVTPGVSRAHAELMVLEEGCSLKDLGSRNGTVLRGEPIAPYKSYPMNPGDSFTIADCTYILRQRGLGANLD
ncbi:FHA domain-containing protein [Paenibacillus sp. alder61]|uniref:FHA domain-containing protein n=1 Tax=Paenibacillus faecis TaxID=862114 RepID=A0A5D0D1Y2_9BACL|nr:MULTISPECIES: DUF6382 domain-containing protein [Paenibacillus]MCA1294421.1 FHA domain-containing protein [Paenibacillus sp. alder61]TYA15167.1 FHA domain-containing protein [Paenibacillus faecis]